ncbi:transposase [Burkholderia ubonensis]|uniref:transposase n=1 Tax=Burkholderia ubonensis TaxID=101571 RepID=UPI0022B75AEF|nr:transposase [Burkholderia ubonensis]
MYWGGEMGLHCDYVGGTSFALKGKTPIVRATGNASVANMISAITNRGELSFMVFKGTFKNATFIKFMKHLICLPLHRWQKEPHVICNLFNEKPVRYRA